MTNNCVVPCYIASAHRERNVPSFLRGPWDSNSMGHSYRSQMMGQRYFENVLPVAFWDMSPRDPKLVPWDLNFGLKNCLMPSPYDAILCVFVVCFYKKLRKSAKTGQFCSFAIKWSKVPKMACFWWFFPFFVKQTTKTHKIASYGDGMRKFLRQIFWSHGTDLGSLGPLSWK